MPPAYSTAFDAHPHLDDPIFDLDRDEVVVRAVAARIAGPASASRPSLSFGAELRTSRRARESVPSAPRDRLWLETDAPARSIEGTRGEPSHLLRVAGEIVALRNEGVEAVLAYTGHNARRLLGVPESP